MNRRIQVLNKHKNELIKLRNHYLKIGHMWGFRALTLDIQFSNTVINLLKIVNKNKE